MKKLLILLSILAVCSMKQAYTYNPAHLKILVPEGNSRWNKWRKTHPNVKPDLSNTIIKYGNFGGDFSFVNFSGSTLIGPLFLGTVF